jgi:hypothetical protein
MAKEKKPLVITAFLPTKVFHFLYLSCILCQHASGSSNHIPLRCSPPGRLEGLVSPPTSQADNTLRYPAYGTPTETRNPAWRGACLFTVVHGSWKKNVIKKYIFELAMINRYADF